MLLKIKRTFPCLAVTLVLSVSTSGQNICDRIRTLARCPTTGCAADPRSPEATLNRTKRRQPHGTRPKRLTFADFESLQQQTDPIFPQKVHLKISAADRQKLKGLRVSSGTVDEGSFVKLVGFLAFRPGKPHASGAESVNCRLSGQANQDFHIPVVERAGDTEFEGIVVEMIPQRRPQGWTIPKIKRIGARKVLVTGALFYDNEHIVNKKPRSVIGGQPKRFSLWEIHPVKGFFVCLRAANACDDSRLDQWTRLVDFAP